MAEQPQRMEKAVSGVLAAIPHEQRVVIADELRRRNPELLAKLCDASEPTNDQSDAVVDALSDELSAKPHANRIRLGG